MGYFSFWRQGLRTAPVCAACCRSFYLYNMKEYSFRASISHSGNKMALNEIIVPAALAAAFNARKGAVRILCSIEGMEEFPCALNPRKGGGYVIIASKQLIKSHKLENKTDFEVKIRPDLHEGLALPEEFSEVLIQDEWGSQLFDELLPGRKRGLIHYVRSAKSVDTRIRRSFEIVGKLKQEKSSGK